MAAGTHRSMTELAGDAMSQLAKLIGNEFDLIRAEISQKVKLAAVGAGLVGAGALLLIPALVVLLFAAASALIRAGFTDPIAYLITGGIAAIVALILIAAGISRFSGEALKLKASLNEFEQDKLAAKEIISERSRKSGNELPA